MPTTVNAPVRFQLLTDDDRFNVLAAGDRRADGRLYFAIVSTKIYCRPGCPARTPLRKNVRYYYTPESAERSGFRACKRCHPQMIAQDPAMAVVDAARAELDRFRDGSLTVNALADRIGQRADELEAALGAMLGTGAAEFIAARIATNRDSRTGAATVGTYASDAHLRYTLAQTSLGHLMVAATPVGLRAVWLSSDPAELAGEAARALPEADLECDHPELRNYVARIEDWLEGGTAPSEMPLDVTATAFQWRVWQALREIPAGETRSYREIAVAIGKPAAARAVASACGANHVALVIPCHRVVRGDGGLGGFRWGVERKAELLRRERSWAEMAH